MQCPHCQAENRVGRRCCAECGAPLRLTCSACGFEEVPCGEAVIEYLVPFHHDPAHTDADLDRLVAEAVHAAKPFFKVTPGTEGATFTLTECKGRRTRQRATYDVTPSATP